MSFWSSTPLITARTSRYRSGFALVQGTTNITVEERGTTRLPHLNQLDLSLRRSFRLGNKVFSPRFDAYNLLNNATITGRTTILGPNYCRVNSI